MWNMLSGLINKIHVGTCRWQGTNTEETPWSDGSVLPADTFQAGGGGIFIWVPSAGAEMKFVVLKINFVCVTSSVTGQCYRDMLDNHVLLFVRLQRPTEDFLIKQENMPPLSNCIRKAGWTLYTRQLACPGSLIRYAFPAFPSFCRVHAEMNWRCYQSEMWCYMILDRYL